ncbi:hypothetical protein [Enterobacter kobei]|uniref:hypothetical protein n=1 Tax=Enterobacter kobei TaxID=208224 RepID=UPI003A96ECCE
MKNILVISGHPELNHSVANATILDEVATQELYTADGFFGHAIEEYLIPFETTARLCNLELLAPVYTCGISYADRDADKIAQQKTLARQHASRLVDLLNTVRK